MNEKKVNSHQYAAKSQEVAMKQTLRDPLTINYHFGVLEELHDWADFLGFTKRQLATILGDVFETRLCESEQEGTILVDLSGATCPLYRLSVLDFEVFYTTEYRFILVRGFRYKGRFQCSL